MVIRQMVMSPQEDLPKLWQTRNLLKQSQPLLMDRTMKCLKIRIEAYQKALNSTKFSTTKSQTSSVHRGYTYMIP